jgi:hypothetical protein
MKQCTECSSYRSAIEWLRRQILAGAQKEKLLSGLDFAMESTTAPEASTTRRSPALVWYAIHCLDHTPCSSSPALREPPAHMAILRCYCRGGRDIDYRLFVERIDSDRDRAYTPERCSGCAWELERCRCSEIETLQRHAESLKRRGRHA